MNVLRTSFPIIATSFVNKSCQIGMSLLPMILVDRQVGTLESSVILAIVKGAHVGGPYGAGRACDRWGMKKVLLASFMFSALGLAGMATLRWIPALALAAAIAQFGQATFTPPARLLLVRLVGMKQRQESIAWLRTANNMGQIVSYFLGAVLSTLGIPLLVLLDAATSAFAFLLGCKVLPDVREEEKSGSSSGASSDAPTLTKSRKALLYKATFFMMGFSAIYDLYLAGAAGLFREKFGESGLRIFSWGMVINTILCSVLAVAAARALKDPNRILPLGLFLIAVGGGIACQFYTNMWAIFGGMFILTAGEILYGALGQYLLIQILPGGAGQGSLYGLSITLQAIGKIIGSGLAFPFVVRGSNPGLPFFIAMLPFLAVWWLIRKDVRELTESTLASHA